MVGEGITVDVVYVESSKAFHGVFLCILIGNLRKHRLDRWVVRETQKLVQLLDSEDCDLWHEVWLDTACGEHPGQVVWSVIINTLLMTRMVAHSVLNKGTVS